ncbi:MAG: BMP family protein [Eubacteriales bacterium]|nr:BMP family protein [Eubacteriales bacterium]
MKKLAKKVVAMVLAGTMVLGLAACGGSKTDAPKEDSTQAAATKDYKVAMICNSSINDGGWGSACYNAMVDAAEKMSWQYEVTDSISQDAYYDTIISYCQLGYNMIYAPGNEYTDAVVQAAEEYPDIAFALLNGAEDLPASAANKNITSLLPNAQQIGWIAGALAGLMSETGTIAFIGGMELDTTLAKYDGFVEAAQYVAAQEGKEVKALDAVFAGSFDDSNKGIEFAKAMIDQGADVFFGDASAVDSGARQAIDEANKAAGAVKIFDIAQPSDILGQNECIICSQVTDNSAMISACMQAVEDGTFGGEVVYGSLQNGALSAGAVADIVPEEIATKYADYLQQMMDETFMK